jgi:translation initiation factor 1
MKAKQRSNSELVYSTDGGGRGKRGSPSKSDRRCAPSTPKDGVVRVGRETKGRKGKCVTTITGAPLGGEELAALAKELKGLCGAGGTLRGDVIEIQGDHRDRIVEALQMKGWTVKRAGG